MGSGNGLIEDIEIAKVALQVGMIMKNIISYLAILAIFTLSSVAQAKNLGIQDASGAPGDIVAVVVVIDDAKDLLSADITLTYDQEVLILKDVKKATLTGNFIIAYNGETGKVSIAIATAEALQNGNGAVVEVSFQIINTAQVGMETNIQILRATLYSGTYQSMEKTLQGGKVTVRSAETVSTPATLTGPTSGTPSISYSYSTGGSTSSLGHTVEYQFDWMGDGSDHSAWGSFTQSKTWTVATTYNVRTRARCTQDISVVSDWSSGLAVTIITETVSTPNIPSGPISGIVSKSNSYTAGGSSSNLGHLVEYQFDWKGDESDLSVWGSTTQSKTWSVSGIYNVRARARCATDTSIVSNWSDFLSVGISVSDISVTPTAYDFGNVKVKKSKAASFKVMNGGKGNLSIITSTITGTDASIFTITSGGGSKTIKPGKSLTMKITFKPTSKGSKSANLEITSNDPDTPTIDIPLSGTVQ